MCNLYSVTSTQQAIRDSARAWKDSAGNMPPLPGVFPDYRAPIVRNHAEGRELATARWGMPSPVFALKGRNSDPGVTNVRNVTSPHWRRWLELELELELENRCVVPFSSFSEHEQLPDGSRPPVWFALSADRPLAFFAGIWTRWTSVRKVKEGETTHGRTALAVPCTAQARVDGDVQQGPGRHCTHAGLRSCLLANPAPPAANSDETPCASLPPPPSR